MEKVNHGLNELYKYAYSNSMTYEDRLRSTNVDTFKASYSFSTKSQEFIRDTTLDSKDWWM